MSSLEYVLKEKLADNSMWKLIFNSYQKYFLKTCCELDILRCMKDISE